MTHEHQLVGQDFHRGCAGAGGEGPAVEGGDGDFEDMFDDRAYSYAQSDPSVLSQVLSRKYNLLEEWIHGNKLVINPDKTHLMVMGSKRILEARKQVSIQAGPLPSSPQKLRNCWEVTSTSHSIGTTASEIMITPSCGSSPAR